MPLIERKKSTVLGFLSTSLHPKSPSLGLKMSSLFCSCCLRTQNWAWRRIWNFLDGHKAWGVSRICVTGRFESAWNSSRWPNGHLLRMGTIVSPTIEIKLNQKCQHDCLSEMSWSGVSWMTVSYILWNTNWYLARLGMPDIIRVSCSSEQGAK